MRKSFKTTTNETFTTSDNRIVRFEDIFEGIDTSIQSYGAGRGKHLPKQDLEDMFQDAALKVIANQASFDLDKCHGLPQAFGHRVATYQEFDAFRKAEKRRKTFTSFERTNEDGDEYDAMDQLGCCDEAYEPDRELESKEAESYIWDKMDTLNERYRQVLTLSAGGEKPREIARILGCKPKEASMLLFRARQAMKKALGADFLRHYGYCA